MSIANYGIVYYEYDGIYQLVKEDRRESDDSLVYINYFEYDLAGNRTHLHYVDSGTDDWTYYTYNIENQLTIEEKGGTATYYTYDPAGALLSKKTGEDESTYDYTYEGLMKEFTHGEDVATYKFDAASRRIEKTLGETTTKFEYNGVDVVAEYDGNDVLQATFNTPSIDQNLTQKRSGNIYHYLQDGLGSVRNLLDTNEVAQNTYDYEAFGAVYGSPTENISNRYRYTAREWESIPSLHYYRARMMDQAIGRFISKDPIFNPNLYGYVKNNPIMHNDPSGMAEEPPFITSDSCFCGPDITEFLVNLVESFRQHWENWNEKITEPEMYNSIDVTTSAHLYMLTIGMNLDWLAGGSAIYGGPNNISCPHGETCKNTYSIFKSCVHDHWIGNFMYGYIGCLLGIPMIELEAMGGVIQRGGGLLQLDPLWDIAGYHIGERMCKKVLQNENVENWHITENDVEDAVLGDPNLFAKSRMLKRSLFTFLKSFGLYPETRTNPDYVDDCHLCPIPARKETMKDVPGGVFGEEWPPIPLISVPILW